MKIEKINDSQIRCTLSRSDLESRKIQLSELIGGGEKMRGLFREMLLQACREVGFDFSNKPLMIEASPNGSGQLVLTITSVQDPEALNGRFPGFSLDEEDDRSTESLFSSLSESLTGADDVLNLLKRISQVQKNASGAAKKDKGAGQKKEAAKNAAPSQGAENAHAASGAAVQDMEAMRPLTEEEIYQYTRFYLFRDLENVLKASRQIGEAYQGENSLFKNPDDGAYYLLIRKMDTDPEQFNRICNILSEYAMPMDYATGMDEFFREHMQVILSGNAVQSLRMV